TICDERLLRIMQSFVLNLNLQFNFDSDNLQCIPLKGGGSKAMLYRFDIEQDSYVLRLLPPEANNLTRQHQITLAIQAGKIGVGPQILFVDPHMEAMVMSFISGRTIQKIDTKNEEHLASFAKTLKKLHTSTEKFPIAVSPFKRFHNFVKKGEKEIITYPSRFAEVKTLMEELETTFNLNPVALVPCHLDLHPLNILLSNQEFLFVDWVNGGLSDPYFDLTTFSFFQDLSEAQTINFLTNYFERSPNEFEWNRFIVTKPIRLFVIAAALLSSFADKSRPISYQEAMMTCTLPLLSDFEKIEKKGSLWLFGLALLKSGLELIDQANFKAALALIQKTP
ncbi:MAG TPA: phosphotransferase, partial [Parachlamydiaceae bacterium]|nr:phosphotransferase [Parachlamydiaceae bacterium]